jgi:dienelactone hydrolase
MKRRTAAWTFLAAFAMVWAGSCAPTLHGSAIAPVSIRVETSHFESGGHRIRAEVYHPRRAGRCPAVIVIHGSSGVHRMIPNTASRYARALAEQGLVAVVVHYFDATGTVLAGMASERKNYFIWAGVLRDAVTWVSGLPEVEGGEVGILGHSLGAFLAVGVAASDPRVGRVVLFGGGLEPFLQDKVDRMPPTLVFHGDADAEVPLSDAKYLVDFVRARGCEVQLRVLRGEGHTFSQAAVEQALTQAARFFTPALRVESGE